MAASRVSALNPDAFSVLRFLYGQSARSPMNETELYKMHDSATATCAPIPGELAAEASTPSGLPFVGALRWGDHFSQFYETAEDLRDCLVPFFRAGLENNEKCLWVASEPFGVAEATAALRASVPDLDALIAAGQIDIIDHGDWYERNGHTAVDDLPETWLARVDAALAAGYAGLRVTGNVAFLEASGWHDFMHYEAAVHRCFQEQRIVALCSYPIGSCRFEQVLDVIRSHGFAIARRNGHWEIIEGAAHAEAKAELRRLNRELEARIEADERQRWLTAELNHRVKNILATVHSVAARTLPKGGATETFLGRITALARAQDLRDQEGTALRALLEAELTPYRSRRAEQIRLEGEEVALEPMAAETLGMVLHELATNAAKYGALSVSDGRLDVVWQVAAAAHGRRLLLTWTEQGGPPVAPPARPGFGSRLIEFSVSHQLGGTAALDFRTEGVCCVIDLPFTGELGKLRAAGEARAQP